MGQKESRQQRVYRSSPRSEGATEYSMLKKAGSLSTLAAHGGLTGRKEKVGSLRRSRSVSDRLDEADFLEKLRDRVEKEAKELNDWAHDVNKNCPETLLSLSSLAIASSLRTPLDIERLPCKRSIKMLVEFMLLPAFDESIANPAVVFSNGGHTITYNGKSYSTTVLNTPMDRGLCRGRHAWIYYIENSRVQGWMQIGAVDKNRWSQNCTTIWDGNPHPHRKGEVARRSNGNFHSGIYASEATIARDSIFLGGYTKGDTIAVKLDCVKHEMQWTKNGESYGKPVSVSSLGPLWPCVSLDSPGEAVSLVYYTCSVRSGAHRLEYLTSTSSNSNTKTICNDSINLKPIHSRPIAVFKKHATLDRF